MKTESFDSVDDFTPSGSLWENLHIDILQTSSSKHNTSIKYEHLAVDEEEKYSPDENEDLFIKVETDVEADTFQLDATTVNEDLFIKVENDESDVITPEKISSNLLLDNLTPDEQFLPDYYAMESFSPDHCSPDCSFRPETPSSSDRHTPFDSSSVMYDCNDSEASRRLTPQTECNVSKASGRLTPQAGMLTPQDERLSPQVEQVSAEPLSAVNPSQNNSNLSHSDEDVDIMSVSDNDEVDIIGVSDDDEELVDVESVDTCGNDTFNRSGDTGCRIPGIPAEFIFVTRNNVLRDVKLRLSSGSQFVALKKPTLSNVGTNVPGDLPLRPVCNINRSSLCKTNPHSCALQPRIDTGRDSIKHNDLERRRRAAMAKDFVNLRQSVPAISGEEKCTKLRILEEAKKYIELLKEWGEVLATEKENVLAERQRKSDRIRLLMQTKEFKIT